MILTELEVSSDIAFLFTDACTPASVIRSTYAERSCPRDPQQHLSTRAVISTRTRSGNNLLVSFLLLLFATLNKTPRELGLRSHVMSRRVVQTGCGAAAIRQVQRGITTARTAQPRGLQCGLFSPQLNSTQSKPNVRQPHHSPA